MIGVVGPIAPLFGEIFLVGARDPGISLAYQLGSLVGGGLAPILAAALFQGFGSGLAIGLYLCFMSLSSAAAAFRLFSIGARSGDPETAHA